MLLFTAAIVLAISGCSSTSPPPGIAPVTPFDLARYEGRWYEVARLDHSFERGMTDVSATYQRQSDGTVQVLNRGFDTGKNDWRQAEGKAKFTGDKNTASLKVSFFGPFYGGYHVAALDADYQWALVVGQTAATSGFCRAPGSCRPPCAGSSSPVPRRWHRHPALIWVTTTARTRSHEQRRRRFAHCHHRRGPGRPVVRAGPAAGGAHGACV